MPPLDPSLLDQARTAATRVIDAEKQLQIAKAEYHAEVRRLHLAGASLREIAGALSMSHQRVQQIVDEAGGSWWSRVWRNRKPLADTACSFCSRTRAEVDKLVSGPDFFICDGCIERAERAARQRAAHAGFRVAAPADKAKCSFCGQRQQGRGTARRFMIVGSGRHICEDCLAQCRQIIGDARD